MVMVKKKKKKKFPLKKLCVHFLTDYKTVYDPYNALSLLKTLFSPKKINSSIITPWLIKEKKKSSVLSRRKESKVKDPSGGRKETDLH